MYAAVSPSLEIDRNNLQHRVAARLREMLIEGLIAPGAKLNERDLSAQFGVSRTPLREAVRMLAAEGLVSLDPGRGAFAVALSAQDVMHTFDVIAVLEGLAAELAAAHITDGELAELRALQFEMEAAFERHDLPGYYRINAQIHDAISLAARNPVLRTNWQQLNARLHALRFRSNQDGAKWRQALEEHAAMVDGLARRDGASLRQLLIEHLQRKRDAVLEQLRVVDSGACSTAERCDEAPR